MIPPGKSNSPRTPRTPHTPPSQDSGGESPGAQTPPSGSGTATPDAWVMPDYSLDRPALRSRLEAPGLVSIHIGPAPQNLVQPPEPTPAPGTLLPDGTPASLRAITARPSSAQTPQVPEADVDNLLNHWPEATPPEQEPAAQQQALVQHTVATTAVALPCHWETLGRDLQDLVIKTLFGHADQLTQAQAAQAAEMQHSFGHLRRVSSGMQELVLSHHDCVLFCALRLAPMSHAQLLGTPLHRLLGHGVRPKGPPNYPLIHTLQALASAIARLPTDEMACHAALALGRSLLEKLNSPQVTAQDRRTLMLTPVLMVQALRQRLHRSSPPNEAIGSALHQLTAWACQQEPGLALPVLVELRYTVTQLQLHDQGERIPAYDLFQLSERLDASISRACPPRQSFALNAVNLLAQHVPDPWGQSRGVPLTPEELTRALALLADYPYAFVGFASEALPHLRTTELNPQQAELLQRCETRNEHPLSQPGPATHH